MAGFFGFFDYSKPGKGVEKDEPKKNAFFLFWELVWRKFSRMILLNLIYFVITLPILSYIYMMVYSNLEAVISPGIGESVVQYQPLPYMLISAALGMPGFVSITLLVISVLLYGPATCGLTYILRNMAREEHSWFSDFFDRARQNLRQGIILGVLDVVVVTVLLMNITNTVVIVDATDIAGFLMTLSRYVSVVILAMYVLMRNYTYMLAVTFELKIRHIIKNSWLLAIVGWWRSLLAVILIAITIIAAVFLNPYAELVLMPLFVLSFCGFISVFICYPVVKKYMLDKVQGQEGTD